MKLIINAAGICATGPTQVAISFIYECIAFNQNEYHVFLSETVSKEINKNHYPPNFIFYEIPWHPMHDGILHSFLSRKLLRKYTAKIHPDVVFSVFGPSYWIPGPPHLQGYAQAHYVYPDSPFFHQISFNKHLKWAFIRFIHTYAFKYCGNYFVCETTDISGRVSKLLNIPNSRVYTVTNTHSSVYSNPSITEDNLLSKKQSNEFRFLTLCSYMAHKNLKILNLLVPILKTKIPDWKIVFILTIDDVNFNQSFTSEAKNSIINLGRVSVDKCPQLYSECDALFLPTLLECFSANYPEAMIMRKPILTSDLPFAKAVCGDAALYFDPLNVEDIALKISLIISDALLRSNLIEKGEKKLKEFDTANSRAIKYLNICKEIAIRSVNV